jgi:hypothetical protein
MDENAQLHCFYSNALGPGEEDAERYVLGHLTQGELLSFEEHLLLCEPCRTSVSRTEVLIAEIRRASEFPSDTPSPHSKSNVLPLKPSLRTMGYKSQSCRSDVSW